MKREILIILAVPALVFLQTSFLNHFPVFDAGWFKIANPVLLFVVFWAIFEKKDRYLSYLAAFWGGFCLQIYSHMFFGFWIAIFLVLTAFIKIIFKRYVRIPSFW